MKNIEGLLTQEQIVEQMRSDAAKIFEVAEIVRLNAKAFVLIVKHEAPVPISDTAAAKMPKILAGMLNSFAHQLTEAADATDAGEVEAKIVDGFVSTGKPKH
jgi:hypothetical protein